jgi:hypothetical protein
MSKLSIKRHYVANERVVSPYSCSYQAMQIDPNSTKKKKEEKKVKNSDK